MNEAETRAELIDPALKAVGWGDVEGSRVLRESHINLGRLQGAGRRGEPEIADYVLVYRNIKLAVIEAKRQELPLTEGVGQAKHYASKLQVRFTYASNGLEIYQVDMETGTEGEIDAFPSPDELWRMTFTQANQWRERFADVPFEDKGGAWQPRYYQDIAVQRVLEALASGQNRILLTLATGTGKTAIAFQIAWKLFRAEKSDIFDVLAYIAFALAPITREERVVEHKDLIYSHYNDKQQAFLDFVLTQYINEGVGELHTDRIASFLELKYGGLHDAKIELGEASQIRETFVGFQRYLFEKGA